MLSLLLNGKFGLDVPAAPRLPVLWDKALYTSLWHSLGILWEAPGCTRGMWELWLGRRHGLWLGGL